MPLSDDSPRLTASHWLLLLLLASVQLAHVLDFAISFGMLTAIFALIYKVMPRCKVEWHDVWIGAATTAVLFLAAFVGAASGAGPVLPFVAGVLLMFLWITALSARLRSDVL